MDETRAEHELLHGGWAARRHRPRFPSRPERLRRGRKAWFGRMAAKGFVPATEARMALVPFVQATVPELFDDVGYQTVCKYVAGSARDLSILPPNGYDLEECQHLRVRLEGARHLVPVMVNARSRKAAIGILRRHLPRGTDIRAV